jgi:hypothetical protein
MSIAYGTCHHAGWSGGVRARRTFLLFPLLPSAPSLSSLLVPSVPSSLSSLPLPSWYLWCYIALLVLCTCWGVVSRNARAQGACGAEEAVRPRRVWFVCACVPATGCGRCFVLSCAAKRLGDSGQLLLGSGCCQGCVRGVAAGRAVAGAVSCARLCVREAAAWCCYRVSRALQAGWQVEAVLSFGADRFTATAQNPQAQSK